ncbi:MAG TPA: helix-turn-helix domain-containing protein [Solirubrobacteraceae bacterium]|nr:helix-turn-helix domain-containing protein [Solirubrobacteraceae bacterium]
MPSASFGSGDATDSPAAITGAIDLAALEEITAAVESGAGLPTVVRAAARALDSSVVVLDRAGQALAVAARSPADERSLLADADGVDTIELRVADADVGRLRIRSRGELNPALLRILSTLIASEVERDRAPELAVEEAAATFVGSLLSRELTERDAILAAAREVGLRDLERGAAVLIAHAHPQAPAQEGWRSRLRAVSARAARAAVPGAVAVLSERGIATGAEVIVLLSGADDAAARRAAEAVLRDLEATMGGFVFVIGRSRPVSDPLELARAADEALLAANVAEGDQEHRVLAFEETGAYRLLLSAMSENPAELQRFYAETVEPLVAYDEQYATDLVATVEAFLDADGNVAGTAQRLFTHRHTIRYRLERVRELCGLDVGSSDGREKLSLGLKAMRVLGMSGAVAPSSEPGHAAGRVPRR